MRITQVDIIYTQYILICGKPNVNANCINIKYIIMYLYFISKLPRCEEIFYELGT